MPLMFFDNIRLILLMGHLPQVMSERFLICFITFR